MYSCGAKLAAALIWNQNPDFETAYGELSISCFQPNCSNTILKIFLSPLGVGDSLPIHAIPVYSCGWNLTAALIWNKNPGFAPPYADLTAQWIYPAGDRLD